MIEIKYVFIMSIVFHISISFPSYNHESDDYLNNTVLILLPGNRSALRLRTAIEKPSPWNLNSSVIMNQSPVVNRTINSVLGKMNISESQKEEELEKSFRKAFDIIGKLADKDRKESGFVVVMNGEKEKESYDEEKKKKWLKKFVKTIIKTYKKAKARISVGKAYDKLRDKSILIDTYENNDNDQNDDNIPTTKCAHNHDSSEIFNIDVEKDSHNNKEFDNGKETRQDTIENVVEYDKDLYKSKGRNNQFVIDNTSKIKQQESESEDDYEMSKENSELDQLQDDQDPSNNIKDVLRLDGNSDSAFESTYKQESMPVKDKHEAVDSKYPFNDTDTLNKLEDSKEKEDDKPVLRFKSFKEQTESKRFNADNSDKIEDGYEIVNTNYLSNDTTNPMHETSNQSNKNREVLKFKSFIKKTIQKSHNDVSNEMKDKIADSKYSGKSSVEQMTNHKENKNTKIKTMKQITIKSGYKNNDLDKLKEENMKDRYGVKSQEEIDEPIDSAYNDVPLDSNEIIEESVEADYPEDKSDIVDSESTYWPDNHKSNDLTFPKETYKIKDSIFSKENSGTVDANHLNESIYSMNPNENYDSANKKYSKENFVATDSKYPQNSVKTPDRRKKKFKVTETKIVQNGYNHKIDNEDNRKKYVGNSDDDLQGSYANDSLVERYEKDNNEYEELNEIENTFEETNNVEENYQNGGFKPYGEDEQEDNHDKKEKVNVMVVKSGYKNDNLEKVNNEKSIMYGKNKDTLKSKNISLEKKISANDQQDSHNSKASTYPTKNDSKLRKELIKEAFKKHLISSKKIVVKPLSFNEVIHFKKKDVENKMNNKQSYMNVDVSYLQSKDSNFEKVLTSRYKRDLNYESADDLETLMLDDYEAPVAFKVEDFENLLVEPYDEPDIDKDSNDDIELHSERVEGERNQDPFMIHGHSIKPLKEVNKNKTNNSSEFDPDDYDKSFGIFEQF